jgi:arylformamidase
MQASMPLYDISRPVRAGIAVWPGDAPFRVEWTLRRAEGASVNLSELRLSAHTGTHADGPFHASDEGARIGAVPLEAYLGPALLVEARDWPSISVGRVERLLGDERPERILFRTGCWTDPEVFPEVFPAIEPEAARAMAAAGVRLVGTDAPSIDPFDSKDLPTHQLFREAGIANLESLLLDDVPEGRYELIALPLRLEEADASPVRAVLRPL